MSDIITIITKEPRVRVTFNQPLRHVSGIQLVDYDFSEDHIEFKTTQGVSRRGIIIASLQPGHYSFANIITYLNHGVPGITIHGLLNQVHIHNSGGGFLSFSPELEKILNVGINKPLGQSYALSWITPNYHLFANFGENNDNLGLIATFDEDFTARPTNLLAAIPSMSNTWPLLRIRDESPINNVDLKLLRVDGTEVSFGGKQFRISLRVVY